MAAATTHPSGITADGTSPVVIEFQGARKAYPDGTVAVTDLDLAVRRHELLVLVGPSGCGKSTTLRMVNRLVEPTAGRILLEGEDVATLDPVSLRRHIGYVIQNVGLFRHRTVAQNIATVPALLRWSRERTKARVVELLDLVGLPQEYADRYPFQLSGGEQQRVGVARALAADPPVLLMDEPFGSVDPIGRRNLQQEFWRIQRRLGTTVVLVTHDVDEAVRLGDRIAVMNQGGRIEQLADAITLLARPATPVVRDFLGTGRTARLLPITELTAADLDAPTGTVGPGLPVGTRLDEALARLAAVAGDSVPITDERGAVVGDLSAAALLRALRRVGGRRAGRGTGGDVGTYDILIDAFGRIREAVSQTLAGLSAADLAFRPDPGSNSIAWLVWHLTRVQDDHLADAFGEAQVWPDWAERLHLGLPVSDTGYRHTPAQVAQVVAEAPLLDGYHVAVHDRTVRLLSAAAEEDLQRIVDRSYDPPVTLAVRLVSVIADDLQHAGQAAYLRGLIERSR